MIQSITFLKSNGITPWFSSESSLDKSCYPTAKDFAGIQHYLLNNVFGNSWPWQSKLRTIRADDRRKIEITKKYLSTKKVFNSGQKKT